jgi:hypothetical protein
MRTADRDARVRSHRLRSSALEAAELVIGSRL